MILKAVEGDVNTLLTFDTSGMLDLNALTILCCNASFDVITPNC